MTEKIVNLDLYRGQDRLKQRLTVHATAALTQGRMLDDMLFIAPAGSGKTTLAKLVAAMVRDPFHLFMMTSLDQKLFYRFCRRWEGGVLLLDEIHAAPKKFLETLYTAIGQDDKVLHPPSGPPIDVNHITFIGATTESDKLHKPLKDRFKVKPHWEDYTDEEITLILLDKAKGERVSLPEDVARALGRAAGGTPRLTNALVAACRDLGVAGMKVTAESVLDLVGVDADGLSELHMDYLRALDTLNGTSGLPNLCSMLQLSRQDVEDLERYLVRRGMVSLEPTGRTLTAAGDRKVSGSFRRTSLAERRAV